SYPAQTLFRQASRSRSLPDSVRQVQWEQVQLQLQTYLPSQFPLLLHESSRWCYVLKSEFWAASQQEARFQKWLSLEALSLESLSQGFQRARTLSLPSTFPRPAPQLLQQAEWRFVLTTDSWGVFGLHRAAALRDL